MKIIGRELEVKSSLTVYQLLQKLLPMAIIPFVGDCLKVSAEKRVASMSERDLTEMFTVMKNLKFNVLTHRGFKEAVVTAGGIVTDEVDNVTMESKIIGGLYFAGEVMDIDADTGGYNLQLAFSTAYAAANNCTKGYNLKQ